MKVYDLNFLVCTRYRHGSINASAVSPKILLADQPVKLYFGLMGKMARRICGLIVIHES